MASKMKRETLARKVDFLFLMVGACVGLGNVLRFPYICYRNGGGVFLIPYLIAVLVVGIPMIFLEGAMGQFMSRGVIQAWSMVPLFQGTGYMITGLAFLAMCYYSVLFAWIIYYIFSSMTAVLPWSHCGNDWNTEYCRETAFGNQTGNVTNFNVTEGDNYTSVYINQTITDPITEFWERKVLSLTPGIEHSGTVKWDLALCSLLAWISIYLCIWKGIKVAGKISYFTAVAPYVLLIALLLRGVTLEGSAQGIKYYLFPEWEKLGNSQVWLEASVQVFYSYAVGCGFHTGLSSCNVFHHSLLKHYLIISVIQSCTSFLCGFVVFSALGFMANKYGVSMDQVAESGPGLAFIAYPEAISQMPVAPLWAILFFLMLAFIAIDSEFTTAEAFIISIVDLFPEHLQKRRYFKETLTALCCVVWYLIGLAMVTEGGLYVEQLLEWYAGGKIMFLVAFLECMFIAYGYGVNRFQRNIEFMLGHRIGPLFKYFWLLITPALCLVLLITDAILHPILSYRRMSGVYHFPGWSVGVGWTLALSTALFIPSIMIWKVSKAPGPLMERFRFLMEPDFTKEQRRRDQGIVDIDPDVEMT